MQPAAGCSQAASSAWMRVAPEAACLVSITHPDWGVLPFGCCHQHAPIVMQAWQAWMLTGGLGALGSMCAAWLLQQSGGTAPLSLLGRTGRMAADSVHAAASSMVSASCTAVITMFR